jgi:hypothetical protein
MQADNEREVTGIALIAELLVSRAARSRVMPLAHTEQRQRRQRKLDSANQR